VICSLKEIVLSVQSAVPDNWQVSWLIDPRITSAFPNKTLFSAPLGSVLPNHSDEIVQELHLFPFSPVETHLKMCLN